MLSNEQPAWRAKRREQERGGEWVEEERQAGLPPPPLFSEVIAHSWLSLPHDYHVFFVLSSLPVARFVH